MGYHVLKYCDKCGKLWQGYESMPNQPCQICRNMLKIVPDKYFENQNYKILLSKENEQKLIEELVLTSPNFDQYYFDNKENIHGQQSREYNAAMAHGKAVLEGKTQGKSGSGVKCAYCGSTNVSKITNTSKAVHTFMFGIFAMSRNSKQWHCNSCKSDF